VIKLKKGKRKGQQEKKNSKKEPKLSETERPFHRS